VSQEGRAGLNYVVIVERQKEVSSHFVIEKSSEVYSSIVSEVVVRVTSMLQGSSISKEVKTMSSKVIASTSI